MSRLVCSEKIKKKKKNQNVTCCSLIGALRIKNSSYTWVHKFTVLQHSQTSMSLDHEALTAVAFIFTLFCIQCICSCQVVFYLLTCTAICCCCEDFNRFFSCSDISSSSESSTKPYLEKCFTCKYTCNWLAGLEFKRPRQYCCHVCQFT